MDNLARQFEEELKEKMFRAKKECKYNPTRFNQMWPLRKFCVSDFRQKQEYHM